MVRTFMVILGVWHLLLGIHSPVLGSAVEEEAKSDHYLQVAISYTNQADGNKTEFAAFRSKVIAEKNSNHPKLESCLQKISEEFDEATDLVQTAHDYHQIAQAEHLKCQAAVRAVDEDSAKKAKEKVKEASAKCLYAAEEVENAFEHANKYYYEVNEAAKELYKVYKMYLEVKFLYDLALRESAELTTISRYANEETAQSEEEREIASRIREQKEEVNQYLPIARSEIAKAEQEIDRAQQAAISWDESTANSASENAKDACEDAKDAVKKVREACKKGRETFYEYQRKEQKSRNTKTEDVIKLREELMSSIQNIVFESVNASDSDQSTSENTTASEISVDFHHLMTNLLTSIEAML